MYMKQYYYPTIKTVIIYNLYTNKVLVIQETCQDLQVTIGTKVFNSMWMKLLEKSCHMEIIQRQWKENI